MTLFCCDIDGTLLNSHRTLSERTIAAIRAVREAGHSFVLCSSRMPALFPFGITMIISRTTPARTSVSIAGLTGA